MISQREYWDKKIKEWTEVSHRKRTKGVGLIEKVANLFRGPITKRMDVALEIVGPKAKGKAVIVLGCGLGDFCFAILKYQPQKVIGLDISGVAIKEAKRRAEKRKLKDKVEFIQADATGIKKLPEFDIAVGLGFIDYLNKQQLKKLFKLLPDRYFFFSVFEKRLSLVNILHAVYVKIQGCPGAFKYSRKELREIVPKSLDSYFLEKDKMLFITNLPEDLAIVARIR